MEIIYIFVCMGTNIHLLACNFTGPAVCMKFSYSYVEEHEHQHEGK